MSAVSTTCTATVRISGPLGNTPSPPSIELPMSINCSREKFVLLLNLAPELSVPPPAALNENTSVPPVIFSAALCVCSCDKDGEFTFCQATLDKSPLRTNFKVAWQIGRAHV